MNRIKFVFIIFFVTASMVFAVYIRIRTDQFFYKFTRVTTEHNRLKQQLWRKQLQLESQLNPAVITSHMAK
ncbi:MAG: hypothetical protein WDA68_10870 [Phycisphaerae bacterium]